MVRGGKSWLIREGNGAVNAIRKEGLMANKTMKKKKRDQGIVRGKMMGIDQNGGISGRS